MADLSAAFASGNADSTAEKELKQFFVQTSAISEAVSTGSSVCIVSGLKGIGKTATFRSLTEFGTRPPVLQALNSKRYALHLPNTSLRPAACSHEFEYEIAIELMRSFLSSKRKYPQVSAKLKAAAKKHVNAFLKKLAALGGRVGGISILGCGFTLNPGSRPLLSGLTGREDEIEAVDSLIELAEAGVRMRLVIDDPEDIFTASNRLDKALLGGLWLASARLNERSTNLKVIILLKTHIFESVRNAVSDLDHFPDSSARLAWTAEDLTSVIRERLVHFCKADASDWQTVMFGKLTSTAQQSFFKYLLSNLRNGPREMLRWLFLAGKAAKKNSMSLTALKQVQDDFSRDAFRVFNATLGEEYDQIGDVVRSVFQESAAREYHQGELENHISTLIHENKEYQALMRLSWMQSQISNTLPRLFFRSGLLALKLDGSMILPYMEEYTEANYESAERTMLVPLFRAAVSRPNKSRQSKRRSYRSVRV